MKPIVAETVINRPRPEVFAAFCDLERAAERITAIDEVVVLTSGPFAVSTRWRETRTVMGKQAKEEMQVTKLEPDAMYRAEAESRGAHYVSDLTFEDAPGGGTKVTMAFSGRATTRAGKLMSCMVVLFARMTRKMLQRDLDDMRMTLEQD